jgi:hypothetical protein
MPWNDVPVDSDVLRGSEEPDPAEVTGEEGEEYDPASPRIPDLSEKYHHDTLSERLAEEEPDRLSRPLPDPLAGELQAPERGGGYVIPGEENDAETTGEIEELGAEDAAIHIRKDGRL